MSLVKFWFERLCDTFCETSLLVDGNIRLPCYSVLETIFTYNIKLIP